MEKNSKLYQKIVEGVEQGAFRRADLKRGELIYHYTKMESMKSIIENRCFWATEYRYLNDEEEFSYVQKILKDVLIEEFGEFSSKNPVADFLASILEKLVAESLTEYFVISFSTNPDNLTLWAEFANPGCCLGMDLEKILVPGSFLTCVRVIYKEKEQKRLIRDTLEMIIDKFLGDGKTFTHKKERWQYLKEKLKASPDDQRIIGAACAKVVAYYGMGMKSVLFQAEEEYRVICKAEGDVEYRCGRDMLIPFIKVPIRKQEEGQIQKLVLAPLNNTALDIRAADGFMRKHKIENIKIEKSCLHLRF